MAEVAQSLSFAEPQPRPESPIGAAFRREIQAVLEAGPFDTKAAAKVGRLAKAAVQSLQAAMDSGLETTLISEEYPTTMGGPQLVSNPYGMQLPNVETFGTMALRELVQTLSGLLPGTKAKGPTLGELNDSLAAAREAGDTELVMKIIKKIDDMLGPSESMVEVAS